MTTRRLPDEPGDIYEADDPEPPTILLVDDCPDRMAARYLQLCDCGAPIQVAFNVEEAVELARRHPVALVLLSEALDGHRGVQAAQLLSLLPETEELPVIMLGADAGGAGRFDAYDAGVVDYVEADVEADALVARARFFAEFSEERRQIRDARESDDPYIDAPSDGMLSQMAELAKEAFADGVDRELRVRLAFSDWRPWLEPRRAGN